MACSEMMQRREEDDDEGGKKNREMGLADHEERERAEQKVFANVRSYPSKEECRHCSSIRGPRIWAMVHSESGDGHKDLRDEYERRQLGSKVHTSLARSMHSRLIRTGGRRRTNNILPSPPLLLLRSRLQRRHRELNDNAARSHPQRTATQHYQQQHIPHL